MDAKSRQFVEKKPPEANMGRKKSKISRKKTAGGQYGTPKVAELLKQKPPEAKMRHQSYKKNITNKTKNITNKKKIEISMKKICISLITVFHTDSEFRSPSSRFFLIKRKCRIFVISVRVWDYPSCIPK